MSDPLTGFEDLAREYYPGSNKPMADVPGRPTPRATPGMEEWDKNPRKYPVNGVETEFFTIGSLAKALGRTSAAIRRWENEGIIPKARFKTQSSDARGARRLYSRDQIEGIVRIAREEGILVGAERKTIPPAFSSRVLQLFRDLRSAG